MDQNIATPHALAISKVQPMSLWNFPENAEYDWEKNLSLNNTAYNLVRVMVGISVEQMDNLSSLISLDDAVRGVNKMLTWSNSQS